MNIEQEKRCQAILEEAEKLTGETSFDGMDAIMKVENPQLRKIIAFIFRELISRTNMLSKALMITDLIYKSDNHHECTKLQPLEKRIAKLERAFDLVCKEKLGEDND